MRSKTLHGEVHKVLLAANKSIFIIADAMAWRKGEKSPTVLAVFDTGRTVFGTLPARTALSVPAVRAHA